MKFEPDGVELRVQFSRFHRRRQLRGARRRAAPAVRLVFGMVIHAAGRPISRTAFLHVGASRTMIDTPLTARGRVLRVEGRKAFVSAELCDPALLAESARADGAPAARSGP